MTSLAVADWSQIPEEVLDMILKHVDEYEVHWRMNQFKTWRSRGYPLIRPVFDRRPIYHRMGQGCHGIGKELGALMKVSKKRGKAFRPSMMKFKYMKNDESVRSAVSRMDSREFPKRLYPENQRDSELSHKIRKKLEEW